MAETSNKNQNPTKDSKPSAAKQGFTKEKGRGSVKAVLSGDTIVILSIDKTHRGPPVERNITISNLTAPMLSRKKPEKKEKYDDEPFAWASRDFLRKKCIGKSVIYTIEFKNPSGREYGTVFLVNNNTGEQENLATLIVANGWAKVRRPPKEARPEVQELIQLEEQAEKEGRGIWNKEPADIEESIRNYSDTNPAVLYEQLKGKPLTGVVEYVRSGSNLKIVLVPSHHEISLCLSGVQSPDFNQNGEAEPYAREAKFFSEHHILNRDVTLILEGIDKYNFYGSVSCLGHNLAEELLKNGFGKYVEWSGSRTNFVDALKAAEKVAKDGKARIWALQPHQQPHVPTPSKPAENKNNAAPSQPSNASAGEIQGKVVEVNNGGTIVVRDNNGNDYKINLSSIKVSKNVNPLIKEEEKKEEKAQQQQQQQPAPKAKPVEKKITKDAVDRAYAIEAKEYLRKRLIGKRVRCVFDYNRQIPTQSNKKDDRAFYSVYLEKNNVAVELIEAGLAEPSEHRPGEQRSKEYEMMMMAEERAKKLSKGIWAPEDKAPVFYVTDISQIALKDAQKAKQYLPFFQRGGKLRAVVEYEFSASRFKLFVPKESAYIIFSIAAIRTPQKRRASNDTEEYFNESLELAKEQLHQRDVEIEVLSQDKGGAFLGNIFVNKKNFATTLLDIGYAELMSTKDNDHATEYLIAEESAKRGKKNIWKHYDPEAVKRELAAAKRESEEKSKPKQEFMDVTVTEIIDGSSFYVQVVGPESELLEDMMKNLSVEISDDAYSPVIDEVVKAQFTADDAWYRAKVTGKSAEGFEVFYVDYGNSEVLPASRLRPLDAVYKDLAHQAQQAKLAFVKTPALNEDYGQEAALFLRDNVMGKTMLANVEWRDNSNLYLSLGDRESQVHVNAAILRAGLARVEYRREKHLQPLIEKLKEEEEKARHGHQGIWEYGDPGFDDQDDDKPRRGAPQKPKKDAKQQKGKDSKPSGKEEKQ